MTTLTKGDQGLNAFSPPEQAAARDLALAELRNRVLQMNEQTLIDLGELMAELKECPDVETYQEIARTMWEIIFPECLGGIEMIPQGREAPVKLKKRMGWVGKQIKKFRIAANMKQYELAEKAGLPQSHISRLELGKHSPSHKTLAKIARALGVKLGKLDPSEEL